MHPDRRLAVSVKSRLPIDSRLSIVALDLNHSPREALLGASVKLERKRLSAGVRAPPDACQVRDSRSPGTVAQRRSRSESIF